MLLIIKLCLKYVFKNLKRNDRLFKNLQGITQINTKRNIKHTKIYKNFNKEYDVILECQDFLKTEAVDRSYFSIGERYLESNFDICIMCLFFLYPFLKSNRKVEYYSPYLSVFSPNAGKYGP